jgi:hypothetical protein
MAENRLLVVSADKGLVDEVVVEDDVLVDVPDVEDVPEVLDDDAFWLASAAVYALVPERELTVIGFSWIGR